MATRLPDQTAAIAACRQAIARHPDDIAAHERLAQIYQDSGKLNEAANLYLKSGALYYTQRKLDDALSCWRKTIAAHPKSIPAHLNLGKVLREQGKTNAAIAAYRKAVSLDPKLLVAYTHLSGLYFSKGSMDEAKQACLKRLELSPGSLEATESLAMVLERQGNIQEAYQLLLPFIKAGTDHLGLARVYAMTGPRLDPPSAARLGGRQELSSHPEQAQEAPGRYPTRWTPPPSNAPHRGRWTTRDNPAGQPVRQLTGGRLRTALSAEDRALVNTLWMGASAPSTSRDRGAEIPWSSLDSHHRPLYPSD